MNFCGCMYNDGSSRHFAVFALIGDLQSCRGFFHKFHRFAKLSGFFFINFIDYNTLL